MIKEWNLLRALACLSIVFLHSTTQAGRNAGYPQTELFDLSRILLCYATPAFIILSSLILANRYPLGLPEGFWIKRLKFIYLPFVCFAIIDGFNAKYFNPNVFLELKIFNNIFLGTFIGYFIFIIFQFYLLHFIVTKYKVSMTWLLPVSLIVMAIHLSILNSDHPFIQEHHALLKLPFTAWFGYFSVAFVLGKHYKMISPILLKYRWATLACVFLSALFVLITYKTGMTLALSSRLDLFPFVVSMSIAILAWGQLIPRLHFIQMISNYSFGIYLLHWQLLKHLSPYAAKWIDGFVLQALFLFFTSIVLCIVIIRMISLLPFGSFIIGKLNNVTRKERTPYPVLAKNG